MEIFELNEGERGQTDIERNDKLTAKVDNDKFVGTYGHYEIDAEDKKVFVGVYSQAVVNKADVIDYTEIEEEIVK